MPPAKNLGVDLGSTGGDWLFRQEGLVLGPIPGTKLVEMLNAGEIDGRTEVAPMGSSQFKRLAEVDFFKVHYAKAEAKRRVDLSAAQDQKQSAKKRNLKLAVIGGVALALAVAAAVTAQYVAVHGSFKDPDEIAFAISVEPPTISLARAHDDNEELVDYPGAGSQRATQKTARAAPPAPAANDSANAGSTAGTTAAASAKNGTEKSGAEKAPTEKRGVASASAKQPKMSDSSSDPDGLQMAQFDQEAINAVVAQKQKSLYPCFKEEALRTPGMAERIPLEFVIGNEGRVTKLWIDNPKFKSGPLYECLFKELQKWPFKPNNNSGATVTLSFNIGTKK